MNEMYIVFGDYGIWDSNRKLNHGIFTSLEKAEEAKQKIIDFHNSILATCPVKIEPTDSYHVFRHYEDIKEREKAIEIFREWMWEGYSHELSSDFRGIEIQLFVPDVISIKEYPYTEELYKENEN